MAKVVRARTGTPRVEGGGKMKTPMTRGEEDKWRTEGRLERSKLAKTTMMDPRCNDNKARLEDHQINLEGLDEPVDMEQLFSVPKQFWLEEVRTFLFVFIHRVLRIPAPIFLSKMYL